MSQEKPTSPIKNKIMAHKEPPHSFYFGEMSGEKEKILPRFPDK